MGAEKESEVSFLDSRHLSTRVLSTNRLRSHVFYCLGEATGIGSCNSSPAMCSIDQILGDEKIVVLTSQIKSLSNIKLLRFQVRAMGWHYQGPVTR